MSIEKLLTSKAVILYLLEMIDMKYIDLEKSYIAPSGKAFFRIDTDKLAEPPLEVTNPRYILENTIFDLACNYKYAMDRLCYAALNQDVECERKILPNNEDEYYIPYIVSPVGTNEHLTTICVRHKGISMSLPDDFITETINLLEEQPEYNHCRSLINSFVVKANEWVREQIRKKLFDGKVSGEFRQDVIVDNVYLSRRTKDGKAISYIINNWYTHYAKGFVKWTDIDNGEGAIFAALAAENYKEVYV